MGKRRKLSKKEQARRQARNAERQQSAAIRVKVRADLNPMSDPGVGTSPGALGLVKMASEEARHVTCPECGYGAGRHARICSRAT